MRANWLLVPMAVLGLLTCATSHYVRPDEVTEWDYTYSDTDMKLLAEKMVQSLAEFKLPPRADTGKPVLAFLTIGNRTSQHIDTEGIAEKIMVALLKLGKFRIVDRELLKQQAKEIALVETQRIDVEGAVKLGSLIGADYFLTGDVMSIEKTRGATTLAYYKLTMRLVDVRTSEIVWADEQELKKKSSRAWYE
ncbi:MAG: penicillin-binding protein activator LpoB [candidate division WOR-3 bacterium]|uniref:Penicillin-binding protein activator LpoB n=1 Tax=candidate division WOR-3 bacterium TaxID=2052148 RepID=A0A7C3EPS5_UNCW3|nr:penicillin-binding protein activator LpoB [candidate division WOR-3 bacterium]